MKNLKKAASLILAVMMILSLAVPAFAAGENGSITITNVETATGEKSEFSAFKVFDLTVDNGAYIYTIAEDSPWFGLVMTQVGER